MKLYPAQRTEEHHFSLSGRVSNWRLGGIKVFSILIEVNLDKMGFSLYRESNATELLKVSVVGIFVFFYRMLF